jgi:hypothetical protein
MTEITDIDRWISLSERAAQEQAIAANEAFAAAMNKAIKRRREKVVLGTFVDRTSTSALRIRGETAMSGCGSPAAMCAESGYAGGLMQATK